ncbi:lipase maturation factor family protein [Phragmitibacter flavus]|nr:lipase maturation factor family protein [Phragmitibacter flavus]
MFVSYGIAGRLFPRVVALTFLIAFASWGMQFEGLTGERGLMPAGTFLENARAYADREGISAVWRFPTLLWWQSGDLWVKGLCIVGCGLALMVMAGFWQAPLLALMWVGYLSLVTTGDVFMSFQWDVLLLEAGLIAVMAGCWRWRVRDWMPSRWLMLLPQMLLVKLMFLSGWAKLASADAVWADWTALVYHYETQPLPTWLGWWAHQLPEGVHWWCCGLMFGIELVLPVVLLGVLGVEAVWGKSTRVLRGIKKGSALSMVLLMGMIALTGNYTFFNLLTAGLALTVLDDGCWPRRWRRDGAPMKREVMWRRIGQGLVVAWMLGLSLWVTLERVVWKSGNVSALSRSLAPFASVNTYGLFATMTKDRHEIVMEVSDDGIFWQALEWRWKPGDLGRAPGFVAPHQPRLDWQMWFAALHPGFVPERDMNSGRIAWFGQLLVAIVERRALVMDFFEEPPIPLESIRHVRARFYRYEFTTREQRRETGDWWTRSYVGLYSDSFSVE